MPNLVIDNQEFNLDKKSLKRLYYNISQNNCNITKNLVDISDKIATLDNKEFLLLRRKIAFMIIDSYDLSADELFDISFDIILVSDEITKFNISTNYKKINPLDREAFFELLKKQKNYKKLPALFKNNAKTYKNDPQFLLYIYLFQEEIRSYFFGRSIFGFKKNNDYHMEISLSKLYNVLGFDKQQLINDLSMAGGLDFVNIISELIDNDVNLDIALCNAVENCYLELAHLLLKNGANPNFISPNNKDPLLHICINRGEAIIMSLLLRHNAEVDILDSLGTSALLAACKRNDLVLVNILLNFKADPNISDSNHLTPFIAACNKGNNEIINLLVKYNAHYYSIKYLINNGSIEEIRKYIKEIINVLNISKEEYFKIIKSNNIQDDYKINLLEREYNIVKKEIDLTKSYKGIITPETQNIDNIGNTKESIELTNQLYNAVLNSDLNLLQDALNNGADPTLIHPEGLNHSHLIHLASWNGNAQIIQALISGGANVNRINANGNTPLFLAIFRENYEAFKVLIDNGADVQITNNAGISSYNLIMHKDLRDYLNYL